MLSLPLVAKRVDTLDQSNLLDISSSSSSVSVVKPQADEVDDSASLVSEARSLPSERRHSVTVESASIDSLSENESKSISPCSSPAPQTSIPGPAQAAWSESVHDGLDRSAAISVLAGGASLEQHKEHVRLLQYHRQQLHALLEQQQLQKQQQLREQLLQMISQQETLLQEQVSLLSLLLLQVRVSLLTLLLLQVCSALDVCYELHVVVVIMRPAHCELVKHVDFVAVANWSLTSVL